MRTFQEDGPSRAQALLDEQAKWFPGCFLTVVSPTSTLFDGCSGRFDMLNPERQVANDDVLWFASTTKLITSFCYLLLVDRGILALDTDMTTKYEPLKKAASQVLVGVEDGQPKFQPNDKPITLLQLLNQSSGFGMEFGPDVQGWKKVTDKGKGFVNSCKAENLIHTPITFSPGSSFQYGNSAEWLALMFPTITGSDYEEFLQHNIFKPLGMTSTTFYPFGPDWDQKLMPLRFAKGAVPDPADLVASKASNGEVTWEPLTDQLDLLKLPRSREEIEYPAGGGGIYSNTADYARLLQYILRHYLSLQDKAPAPEQKLLSDDSIRSLFKGTLSEPAMAPVAEMMNVVRGFEGDARLKSGEADWTTGMALYNPKNGQRRDGWGRHAGSVGWGGAAGTDYWIDPVAGIAAVWSTQMLPGGRFQRMADAKKDAERAVYELVGA